MNDCVVRSANTQAPLFPFQDIVSCYMLTFSLLISSPTASSRQLMPVFFFFNAERECYQKYDLKAWGNAWMKVIESDIIMFLDCNGMHAFYKIIKVCGLFYHNLLQHNLIDMTIWFIVKSSFSGILTYYLPRSLPHHALKACSIYRKTYSYIWYKVFDW